MASLRIRVPKRFKTRPHALAPYYWWLWWCWLGIFCTCYAWLKAASLGQPRWCWRCGRCIVVIGRPRIQFSFWFVLDLNEMTLKDSHPEFLSLEKFCLRFKVDKAFVVGKYHEFILTFKVATPFVYEMNHHQHLIVVDGRSTFTVCELLQLLCDEKVSPLVMIRITPLMAASKASLSIW